jgi:hypothetical protein
MLALFGALVWVGTSLLSHRTRSASQTLPPRRALLALGMLVCCAALGAARAAATELSADPHSIAPLATGQQVELQGQVAAEPDLRAGKRILQIDVVLASLNGGTTWRPAAGRVGTTVYGPDDWFAPAYGDTVTLTGKLEAPNGCVPKGVLGQMPSARASILSRGGGNPSWIGSSRCVSTSPKASSTPCGSPKLPC